MRKKKTGVTGLFNLDSISQDILSGNSDLDLVMIHTGAYSGISYKL
jgi:hypothetical protein